MTSSEGVGLRSGSNTWRRSKGTVGEAPTSLPLPNAGGIGAVGIDAGFIAPRRDSRAGVGWRGARGAGGRSSSGGRRRAA